MSKAKQLQPVRGTHDLLPEDCRLHRHIEEAMIRVAKRFGFAEMATPIFEFTEVFKRTLGETSDVVNKEMYTFDDRGGTSITLRPEGTAAVARAFISNGLAQQVPFKVVYRGPMFRYERPQKGRQRQFHQFGAELIGVEKPQADIEVLAMASQIMAALGLQERVTLELNTLGDAESRANYRAALVAYFSAYKDKLSEDSRTRLENNPMRILDSKDAGDREIVANAPRLKDHLNAYSADFFQQVCAGLDALGIAYTLNDRLVRGLDYYCHTAFEFTTTELGAQSAVLSGGRYDNLIENMGGAKTAGIGWAAGLERLVLMLDQQRPQPAAPIALIPMGIQAEAHALKLAHVLRQAGLVVDQAYSGNMGKRMKRADKVGACVALILGDDELAQNTIGLRVMATGEQKTVPLDDVLAHVQAFTAAQVG